MVSRIFRLIIVKIKYLPHYIIQIPRIWKYKMLSDAKQIQGLAKMHQPVLLLGKGKIVFGKNVNLGFRPSPYLYSGYIHIEARSPKSKIFIDDNCWINNNCVFISEGAGIEIGANTLFGTNVEIYDSDFHALEPAKRLDGNSPTVEPVKIGKNVFIGSNVRILKGVTIGDNSVIGNSSVVVNSISSTVIAAGNPAKVIKSL